MRDTVDYKSSGSGAPEKANAEAETWKNAFIRLPYYRNRMTQRGLIVDTFETSITWERLPEFYRGLKGDIAQVIEKVTGRAGMVSCRFTHVYPDGACVYISFGAVGSTEGDMQQVLERWCQIKQVANEKVIERGGTITHHHAVGRDHRSGYEKQMPALFLGSAGRRQGRYGPEGGDEPRCVDRSPGTKSRGDRGNGEVQLED